jgi:hypothetical protein
MDRYRRVLNPDHPSALFAAAALANALLRLGESEPARVLARDTMDRSRLIYGGDHPFTVFVTQIADIGLSAPPRATRP